MKSIKGILTRLIIFVIFLIILVIIIALARGYRFDPEEGTLTSTGIISANSLPPAAKIFVNGNLEGVTNTNLTYPPGTYTVKITKDGYTDWEKQLTLKGEIVLDLSVVLFSKNPSLSPLTNLGVSKAIPIGQSEKILIFTQNNSLEKDGIYVLEGNSKRLSLISPLRKVVSLQYLPADINLSKTVVHFAPDYSQAVFSIPNTDESVTYSYLLSLESTTTEPFDVTGSYETILTAWDTEKKKDLAKILETYPKGLQAVAEESFRIIAFSPDETKILYQATQSATIPQVLKNQLVGTNQTPEKRELEANKLYVYDRKEDKNFEIPADLVKLEVSTSDPGTEEIQPEEVMIETEEATNTPQIEISGYNSSEIFEYIQWYPSSKHLVINEGATVSIMDYDGTNKEAVYSGPYEKGFFSLNSDWRLLILANLNPQNNTFGDVYEVGIR